MPLSAGRQTGQDGWVQNATPSPANPDAVFHRRSNITASAACRSERRCSACSANTEATTSAVMLGWPRPEWNRSANICGGNNCLPVLSQEREYAPWQQMPSYRLGVDQLRRPSESPCIRTLSQVTAHQTDYDTAYSFGTLLGLGTVTDYGK